MKADNTRTKMTATSYVLQALIPYTKQNLTLSFHPTKFFNDLEKLSGFSRQTLKQTYVRAKKQGLVSHERTPRLTAKGRQYVQPFVAQALEGGGRLMVIFDIPTDFNEQRRQLRNLLRRLGFVQIQRSIWMSPNDHRDVVREAVNELGISDWVELYEASKIK